MVPVLVYKSYPKEIPKLLNMATNSAINNITAYF